MVIFMLHIHMEVCLWSRFKEMSLQTKKHINILIWNNFHTETILRRENPATLVHECKKCICNFTFEKSALKSSLGVLFDIRFYGMISKNGTVKIPLRHRSNQYWIIYNNEAMFKDESFYNALPGNVYNLTATYRHNSDIHLPYGDFLLLRLGLLSGTSVIVPIEVEGCLTFTSYSSISQWIL